MLSSTPMTQGPGQAERLKPVISIAPMNRMGTPQEIADAVIFLSSSKATFMQGAAMVRYFCQTELEFILLTTIGC
jgi:NAD(P)-dependent dehydrogenase (short-subunit alcohol dehydrogenase family)